MTDIWREKPEHRCIDPDPYPSFDVYDKEPMDTWIEKLRAEWDKLSSEYKAIAERAYDVRRERDELKEKAKKWDFINSVTGFTPQKFIEQKEQLEAVKKWKYGMLVRMPFIGKQGHISTDDLDDLEKILEVTE